MTMRTKTAGVWIALLAFSAPLAATQSSQRRVDNERVRVLFQADQDDRSGLQRFVGASADQMKREQETIFKNDVPRRDKIMGLLKQGAIVTAADHWRAAFVLQHGASVDDIRLAYSLSTIAIALAPGEKRYRWLTAASWDRILTREKQPQWYGTQFETDPKTGLQIQSPLAVGAVTDAERTTLGVPTLAESQDMLRQINATAK